MIKSVHSHQKFCISAVDFNDIVDMTNARAADIKNKYSNLPKNKVAVINYYSDFLPIYSILQYSSTSTNIFNTEEMITFLAGKASAIDATITYSSANGGRNCILDQPLAQYEVGLATVSGVAKVQLVKPAIVDMSKPVGVTPASESDGEDFSFTRMALTNNPTRDKLLWHNNDFTLGVIQLNCNTLYDQSFVGVLKVLPDNKIDEYGTITSEMTAYKIVVENVYSKRQYQVEPDDFDFGHFNRIYMNMDKIPARPKSLVVMGKFVRSAAGVDYASVQPFYATNLEGIVTYDDEQTTLNAMYIGKRSKKDAILKNIVQGGAISYGEYPIF